MRLKDVDNVPWGRVERRAANYPLWIMLLLENEFADAEKASFCLK